MRDALLMRADAGAAALLVLMAVAVASSMSVAAHADFVDSDPPPNARVDTAPSRITIHLSEAVEDRYTRVQVLDNESRDYVASFDIEPKGRATLFVELNPLPDGVYTVLWRALSYDTHTTSGGYLLAVNASFSSAPAIGEFLADGGRGDSLGRASAPEAAARAAGFAGAALALGLPLFVLVVMRDEASEHRATQLFAVAAVASVVAALAAAAFASYLAERTESSVLGILDSATGRLVGLRFALHLVAAALLAAASYALRGRLEKSLGLAGAAAAFGALATVTFASHAAAQTEGRALAMGADLLHLAAASFWVSGVTAFVVLLPRRSTREEAWAMVGRFSPLAVVSVLVVVATGTYAGLLHLDRWTDLWTSRYGMALTVKMTLVVPLIGLGAYNRYVIRPNLRADETPASIGRLRRAVLVEIVLMAVVLAAAGVLANSAPPSTALAGPGPDAGLPDDPEERQMVLQRQGWIHVNHEGSLFVYNMIRPFPVRLGFQNVTVLLDEPNATLPENVAVFLTLKPPSDPDGEGHIVEAERIDEATWAVEGPIFNEPGRWRLDTTVQGKGFYLKGSLRVDVAG